MAVASAIYDDSYINIQLREVINAGVEILKSTRYSLIVFEQRN